MFCLLTSCVFLALTSMVSGVAVLQFNGASASSLLYSGFVAVIVLQTAFIALLMFNYIPGIKRLSREAQLCDPSNQLPNSLSLRKHLSHIISQDIDFALTYIWVAGVEKIELARGSEFRDKYLKLLSGHIQTQLENSSFLPDFAGVTKDELHTFYCGNNTLGVLTQPLTLEGQGRLQVLLNHALGNLGYTYGYNLDVRLVVGSANALTEQKDVEGLLQQTGVTLAQCIQSKQSAMLFSAEVGFKELRQITLLNEFEQALMSDQFYLEWQPQVNSTNNALVGLEALVRWRHPEYGVVPPNQFIPLLEQSSKITVLSLWVLQQAIDKASAFFERFPGIDLSVNLSVYDLMNNQLLTAIDKMLQRGPANIAHQMVLEITESVHMEDNEAVLINVQKLQQRGFRVSIDDFGAGYASFGYLQTLPVDELKIDQRYARSIDEPNSQAIIKSIIDLARRLNVSIVGEGVESERQQELFTRWGVQRLQGWCLGKPVSGEQILQLPVIRPTQNLVPTG